MQTNILYYQETIAFNSLLEDNGTTVTIDGNLNVTGTTTTLESTVLQVADPVPRATSQNDDDDDASQTTFCSSRRRFVLHDDASQLQTQQALAEEHAQRMEETREIARRDPRWAAMLRRHPPGTMYILDADSRRRIDIVPNNQQDYFSFVYR